MARASVCGQTRKRTESTKTLVPMGGCLSNDRNKASYLTGTIQFLTFETEGEGIVMPLWRALCASVAIVVSAFIVPVCIGQTSVAGVVTLANQALLGGASLSDGATVFSGDLISTQEEGQVQIQAGRVKLTLQAEGSFRVFRAGERVVVELERGTMTYAVTASDDLTIYALDTRLAPEHADGASGMVTVVSRCEVKATSQKQTIAVTAGKETKTIEETKTYTVRSEFGVEYHDSWKPTPSDYPDFDPNSTYHHTHSHSACGLVAKEGDSGAKQALGSHFKLAAAVIAGGVTCLVICRDFESPSTPKK